MFKKNKKKEEEKNSIETKIGDLSITTNQSNSERKFSENILEQRSVTYSSQYSSSSYSSVRMTKTELGKSTITTNRSPISNNSLSLFDHTSILKSFGDKIPAIDARPSNLTSTNGGGYQSCFSRKLTPYNIDARPFSSNLEQNKPERKISLQPPSVPYNFPRYSSYLPETPNALTSSSSTQSLPTSTETKTQDPRIPTYDTNGKKRGKVLVINNIKFLQQKQERKGAEIDEKHVKSLFKGMGFDVDTHRDLKKTAMKDKIVRFASDVSLKRVDMSILIMMSHGSNVNDDGRVIQGGFTQIYGVDDAGLSIDEILDIFSAEKCSAMAGKPKIFIFQCCRGESEERSLHNDVAPTKKNIIRKHADMLIAYSTLPGFFSIRDAQQGSWYIQGICDVFKKHAKELDVETLLKIVDEQLSKKHPKYKQTSSYENRGFKRCFLNPR